MHAAVIILLALLLWPPALWCVRPGYSRPWYLGGVTSTFALISQIILMNGLNLIGYKPSHLTDKGTTSDAQCGGG